MTDVEELIEKLDEAERENRLNALELQCRVLIWRNRRVPQSLNDEIALLRSIQKEKNGGK